MDRIERQGFVIVAAGNFNPAIFNPDWLERKEILISSNDANNIEMITGSWARFTVGDFRFEITEEQFVLHILNEPFVKGGDIFADIFARALPETPIRAIGMNYIAHYKLDTWNQQKALGRKIAPIEPWTRWGMDLESDNMESVGGLASISMMQKFKGERIKGHLQVKIEPSRRLEAGHGVYIEVNDHYEWVKEPDGNLATYCANRITESLSRSRLIVRKIIDESSSDKGQM